MERQAVHRTGSTVANKLMKKGHLISRQENSNENITHETGKNGIYLVTSVGGTPFPCVMAHYRIISWTFSLPLFPSSPEEEGCCMNLGESPCVLDWCHLGSLFQLSLPAVRMHSDVLLAIWWVSPGLLDTCVYQCASN